MSISRSTLCYELQCGAMEQFATKRMVTQAYFAETGRCFINSAVRKRGIVFPIYLELCCNFHMSFQCIQHQFIFLSIVILTTIRFFKHFIFNIPS